MFVAIFAMTALLGSGVASPAAAPTANSTSSRGPCASCASHMTPAWVETRRDNPHSTVIGNPNASEYSPTNDEINAAETQNPDSVDYRKAELRRGPEPGDLDLEALEAENPHNAQPGRRTAVAIATVAPKCGCMLSDARPPAAGARQ